MTRSSRDGAKHRETECLHIINFSWTEVFEKVSRWFTYYYIYILYYYTSTHIFIIQGLFPKKIYLVFKGASLLLKLTKLSKTIIDIEVHLKLKIVIPDDMKF